MRRRPYWIRDRIMYGWPYRCAVPAARGRFVRRRRWIPCRAYKYAEMVLRCSACHLGHRPESYTSTRFGPWRKNGHEYPRRPTCLNRHSRPIPRADRYRDARQHLRCVSRPRMRGGRRGALLLGQQRVRRARQRSVTARNVRYTGTYHRRNPDDPHRIGGPWRRVYLCADQ